MERRKLDLSGVVDRDLDPLREVAKLQNDSKSEEIGQRPGDRRSV
jgi:hypothetical protein